MSSGFADDPQEDDEQPPDVAACFMASKSIGFMRLSSDIVNGWLMCRALLGSADVNARPVPAVFSCVIMKLQSSDAI